MPELRVRQFGGVKVQAWKKKFWHIAGINPAHDFVLHNNGIGNLVRGVVERVLRLKGKDGTFVRCPEPPPSLVEDRLGKFRGQLLKNLSALPPMTRQQFVECYSGHRKVRMQKAADSLTDRPLTTDDAMCRVFVKWEVIISTFKEDPVPRVISPRNPRYNVELGKHIKHGEHIMYRAIAKVWGGTTVAKGLNVVEIGNLIHHKFSSFKNCAVVGLDASRFDQHVSSPMLRYEHSVYNRWLNDKELAELLEMQVETSCVGLCKDGMLRYKTRGGRMSGDMNTALGNCLLMCAMVYSYAKEKHIKCQLLNNGDDCIVFMRACDVDNFNQGLDTWFHELGFSMKVEPPVYEIEKIEFCQMHPIQVRDGYIMVRNPDVSLAKDSVSKVPVGDITRLQTWCNSVGVGGYTAYPDIPVISSLYSSYAKVAPSNIGNARVEWEETGLQRLIAGVARKGAILPVTRKSFYVAFGMLPSVQMALEDYYSSLAIGNIDSLVSPGESVPLRFHAKSSISLLTQKATEDKPIT